jgi:3-methyladenine DNA glycosylase AlkD
MTGVRTAPSPHATGEATTRAAAFVAERRARAEAAGRALADHLHDPDAFAAALGAAFRELADPDYVVGQRRVAPGLGPAHGVRGPILHAIQRGFRDETRDDRTGPFLFLADRLFRTPELEARWFAFGLLERTLPDDPERTWQLLRRAAREAGDWITVDTLARVFGEGILDDPYRWAELEQLAFSPSRWERRLVGSTVASLPYVDRRRGREPDVAARGLALLGRLIGDAEPDVQKALAWGYRSLTLIDADAVVGALDREASIAAETGDGHRAWVVRDALSRLPPPDADRLRARVDGVRRRPGAPSTSDAAAIAARFGALPDPTRHPEPPLS